MPAALVSLVAAAILGPPTATPARGAAPLTVTLAAAPGYPSYHWTFGDGSTGDGQTVQHTYAAGEWTATVTAGGESASVVVRAYAISLRAPAQARYGRRITFAGTTTPALAGAPFVLYRGDVVAGRGTTRADGSFTLRTRALLAGPWTVEVDGILSERATTRLVPKLTTHVVGSGVVGRPLELRARLQPAEAGRLHAQVFRRGTLVRDVETGSRLRLRLDTRRVASYRIRVSVESADGYGGSVHIVRTAIGLPLLRWGSAGAAVHQLTARLRQLHYAVPVTSRFDGRVLDSVYAFQKVQGLARTGAVDSRVWQRLQSPRLASPRYRSPASHIEVAKPTQVLYVVRGGRVALIAPVSTGLLGFTPVGRFAIYRKVAGFDPSPLGTLFYPMYFTGGYAIHGNPSVPPYPASHGCVRVPMWIAFHLYETNPYGETVYVY